MEVKIIEIRDRATFIPAMAIKLGGGSEEEKDLLRRAGYGAPSDQQRYVLLAQINGGTGQMTCDPYEWAGSRTYQAAHQHLTQRWDDVEPGSVVDVEFVLGEKTEPCLSIREEGY